MQYPPQAVAVQHETTLVKTRFAVAATSRIVVPLRAVAKTPAWQPLGYPPWVKSDGK